MLSSSTVNSPEKYTAYRDAQGEERKSEHERDDSIEFKPGQVLFFWFFGFLSYLY